VDRKEEILAAATKIFEKYGLQKTTLDDIAKECGIKKTALYYYFKSKDEIIQTMFKNDIQKLKTDVIAKITIQKTATEKLYTYLVERTKSIRYMMKYFHLFIKDDAPSHHRELALKEKRKILQEEIIFLQDVIQEGISNNEFKKVSKISVAYLLLGATHDLGLEDFFYRKDMDIEKEVQNILNIILNGIQK